MQGNPLATQAPGKEKQEQMSTWEDSYVYLGTTLTFGNARDLDFTNKSYINPFFRSRANLIQQKEESKYIYIQYV